MKQRWRGLGHPKLGEEKLGETGKAIKVLGHRRHEVRFIEIAYYDSRNGLEFDRKTQFWIWREDHTPNGEYTRMATMTERRRYRAVKKAGKLWYPTFEKGSIIEMMEVEGGGNP